jgi:hypothetical protein
MSFGLMVAVESCGHLPYLLGRSSLYLRDNTCSQQDNSIICGNPEVSLPSQCLISIFFSLNWHFGYITHSIFVASADMADWIYKSYACNLFTK